MRRWCILGAVLAFCGVAAAGSSPVVKFTEITREAGIEFRHTFGDQTMSKILKATGSGVGIFDYDGDGDLDLYFVNGSWLPGICDEKAKSANAGATNLLYRNDGKDPRTGVLHFTDVTREAGVGDTGYGMGCLVGDYDNDGDTDLYVTNYGPNVLYRNNGNGTFTDVTAKAGVAGPEKLNDWVKWSTNAVFFDYDRDGNLDLWVTNYIAFDPNFSAYYGPEKFPGPTNYLGQPSLLYHNEGKDPETGDVRFRDVTKEAGVWRPNGHGMGASAGDLDGDGWPDIYEANDAQSNFLFRNLGNGKFEEICQKVGAARGQGGENTAAMHGSMGDYNHDGRLDIFVPDNSYFSLFRNDLVTAKDGKKRMFFEDVTYRAGIARPVGQFTGWGGFLFDYDNDGWLDIFAADGHAHREENQPNVVLKGLPDGKFRDVSLALNKRLFRERRLSRGAAAADLDNDGDLDVVVVNIDVKAKGKEGLPTVILNEGGNARNWLQVRLRGNRSNRDGIGAKVWVTAGKTTWYDEARTSPAYLSSTEARMHFGLGDAGRVDRLRIVWPSGATQEIKDLEVNQLLTVTEPVTQKGGKR